MKHKNCPSCQTPIQAERFFNHAKGCKGPTSGSSKPIQVEVQLHESVIAKNNDREQARRQQLSGRLKFVPKPHRATVKAKLGLA